MYLKHIVHLIFSFLHDLYVRAIVTCCLYVSPNNSWCLLFVYWHYQFAKGFLHLLFCCSCTKIKCSWFCLYLKFIYFKPVWKLPQIITHPAIEQSDIFAACIDCCVVCNYYTFAFYGFFKIICVYNKEEWSQYRPLWYPTCYVSSLRRYMVVLYVLISVK